VVVVINDRGPFGGRVIDLSPEAFSALASLGAGVMQVRLTW
jgi:rare lipoprotein A (peptidoglycan hydrolase)